MGAHSRPRSEAGILAQAARDYEARDILIVGVNVWDRDDAARAFLDEFNVGYPNGRDPDATVSVDYGVTGLPETFVVDPQGRIVARWIGPVSRKALDEMINLADAKLK